MLKMLSSMLDQCVSDSNLRLPFWMPFDAIWMVNPRPSFIFNSFKFFDWIIIQRCFLFERTCLFHGDRECLDEWLPANAANNCQYWSSSDKLLLWVTVPRTRCVMQQSHSTHSFMNSKVGLLFGFQTRTSVVLLLFSIPHIPLICRILFASLGDNYRTDILSAVPPFNHLERIAPVSNVDQQIRLAVYFLIFIPLITISILVLSSKSGFSQSEISLAKKSTRPLFVNLSSGCFLLFCFGRCHWVDILAANSLRFDSKRCPIVVSVKALVSALLSQRFLSLRSNDNEHSSEPKSLRLLTSCPSGNLRC